MQNSQKIIEGYAEYGQILNICQSYQLYTYIKA